VRGRLDGWLVEFVVPWFGFRVFLAHRMIDEFERCNARSENRGLTGSIPSGVHGGGPRDCQEIVRAGAAS
jgi:hypothetical protein